MKTFNKASLAAILLSVSTISIAGEISYDFLQATATATRIDIGSGDHLNGNGARVDGSFDIAEHFSITGSVAGTDFDKFSGIKAKTREASAGLTAHTMVGEDTSIFANFSILRGSIKFSMQSDSTTDKDTGTVSSIGVRHMLTNKIELNATGSHLDIFNEKANVVTFGGRLYTSTNISFGAAYSFSKDAESIGIDARLDF